jgi:hypothetical protein
MILLALLLALIVFGLLAIRYGADSRHLAGHDWW